MTGPKLSVRVHYWGIFPFIYL